MPNRLLISPLKRPFPGEQETIALLDLSDVSGKSGSGNTVVLKNSPSFAGVLTFEDNGSDPGTTYGFANKAGFLTWHDGTGARQLYFQAGTDVAVVDGGTGASDAVNARINLGLVIGTNVQAWDATLASLADLGTAADRMAYTTGVNVWAEATLSAFARTILGDADAATARTTLQLGSADSPTFAGITAASLLASAALTIDPTTDLTLELTDNRSEALVAAEGARDYLVISTLDAGASMALGNATTNPTFGFLGTGAATFGGRVEGITAGVAYAFTGDTSTGLTRFGAGDLGLTAVGTTRAAVSATRILLRRLGASAVAGTDSLALHLEGQTSAAARVIALLNEADAGTDTYRLRINDSAGTQIAALESTGVLTLLAGLSATTGTFTSDVVVQGNFTVQGTQHTIEGESVLFEDSHLYLNKSYETAVAQTGGLVVNYLPTATNDTVAAGGFVAGVASTSNPTVITAGSGTFGAGDFIQVSGAANVLNDGLFEILTHTGTTLTIRGIGVTSALEDFTQNQFVTSTTVQGTIRKVTISVLRTGTDGLWEAASGAVDGLGFIDLVNVSAAQNLSTKTLVLPIITDFTNATHTHQNAAGGGQLDHGLALTGLDGDDHTQYALLAGRSGGQTLTGGTASGDDLTLLSTSHGTKGYVIFGSSQAIFDEVNTRFGVGATPLITLHATVSDASASSVSDVLRLEHIVAAAAGANNIGTGMVFAAESTTGGTQIDLARIDAVATDASVAAVTAGIGFSTRTGGGALTKRWIVNGAGHFTVVLDNTYDIGDLENTLRPRHLVLSGRLRTNRGADVASGTTLTLGDDGNFFEITGTATINHMTTTGWQVGSMVIFVFSASLTVNNNAATPPSDTAPFFLSGSANFSATAGDVLMLVLSDAYGTTAWTEVSRTII